MASPGEHLGQVLITPITVQIIAEAQSDLFRQDLRAVSELSYPLWEKRSRSWQRPPNRAVAAFLSRQWSQMQTSSTQNLYMRLVFSGQQTPQLPPRRPAPRQKLHLPMIPAGEGTT